MFSAIKEWAFNLIATRILQPSSVAGYGLALWTFLQWAPNATGIGLAQQLVNLVVSILLFLINERPWTKTTVILPK